MVEKDDSLARFYVAPAGRYDASRESALTSLRNEWASTHPRQHIPDFEWISALSLHLDALVEMRVEHIREWITLNLSRFQSGHDSINSLHRAFESQKLDLKAGVQLCKTQCLQCQLLCTKSRSHEGPHDCQTSHHCIHRCNFCGEADAETVKDCTMRLAMSSK